MANFDLVYILGGGSRWRNKEIMYSLRSLENYKGNFKVFIIGDCPRFIDTSKIVHIKAEDNNKNKIVNAIEKIKIACHDHRISEDFILMNDDFFFLKPTEEIKLLNRGKISAQIKGHSTKAGYYYKALKTTKEVLENFDIKKPIDFEVHYPIIFNKKRFLKTIGLIDYKNIPILFRSFYCNLEKKCGVLTKDCKAYDVDGFQKLKHGEFLSTDNCVVLSSYFQRWIMKKFHERSRFELVPRPTYYVKSVVSIGGRVYNPGDRVVGNFSNAFIQNNLRLIKN